MKSWRWGQQQDINNRKKAGLPILNDWTNYYRIQQLWIKYLQLNHFTKEQQLN